MRQSEIIGCLPIVAGRPIGRPAFSQDCAEFWATCGDGARCVVSLRLRSLRLNRPVGGSICGINIEADEFDGVALASEGGALIVRLLHRDPWLTIDLVRDVALGAALDLRDQIARQFRLPAVLIDADGRMQSDCLKYGAVLASVPAPRRSSTVNRMRPRFLRRRSMGFQTARDKLAGREIIARA